MNNASQPSYKKLTFGDRVIDVIAPILVFCVIICLMAMIPFAAIVYVIFRILNLNDPQAPNH